MSINKLVSMMRRRQILKKIADEITSQNDRIEYDDLKPYQKMESIVKVQDKCINPCNKVVCKTTKCKLKGKKDVNVSAD